uniref:Uncharacterized protein n=1 Tax=Panagrolaimus sp. PS1159 TaxID=55785 RepID=A0AC35FXX4_9BILA
MIARIFIIFSILAIFCLIFVSSAPLIPVDPYNSMLHDVLPISEPRNMLPDDHIGLHSVDDVIVKHPI